MKTEYMTMFAWALLCIGGLSLRAQTPTPADIGAEARKQQADAAMADAERTLTVRLIDKAIAQADTVNQLLGQVATASKALSDRMEALKENEEGKRLAAALDEISAQQVQGLYDQPPVLAESLDAMQKELDSSTADLKKLHDNPPPGFVPPDQQQDELTKDGVTLRNMLAKIRERDRWLTTQISGAPKDLDLAKAPKLDAALADFRQRQQQAWNVAQRKGIDQAKQAALDQVTESAKTAELERSLQHAQALLEQERFEAEQAKIDQDMKLKQLRDQKEQELADVNRKLADSEAKRTVANAQSDAVRDQGKADAEKVRLVQKCQDPKVKELLGPFLSTGLWQPGDEPGRPYMHDRGPMSLKALKATGALDATEKGLTALYLAGNAKNSRWAHQKSPDTERSKWGYASEPRLLSQDDWADIRKAQDLLNELGDTLVDQKMLAP